MRSLPVLPLVVTVILASVTLSVSAAIEKLLVFRLLDGYTSVAGRPVSNASQAVPLKVGLSLIRLGGVDTEQQTMSAQVFLRMTWQDDALKWDPEEYEGVTRLTINRNDIWTPDIELFNAAGRVKELLLHDPHAVVRNDGTVILVPFLSLTVPCDAEDTNNIICDIVFGSWVYPDHLVRLEVDGEGWDMADLFKENPNLMRLHSEALLRHTRYDCCPDDIYSSIAFRMSVKSLTHSEQGDWHVSSGVTQHADVTTAILAVVMVTAMLL